MITQRRLQHLLTLVRYAHFGRAAIALNISQPALTKSIQALEAELGVTLLDRKRGAVTLTAFGELVVQRGKSLLSAEEDMLREIALLAGLEIGSLRVALGPYPSVISGYPALARLLAQRPKISITVHVASWRDVVRQVQQARRDAKLLITDRITVRLGLPARIAAAVRAGEHVVRAETLADAVTYVDDWQPTGEVDGEGVHVAVARTAG